MAWTKQPGRLVADADAITWTVELDADDEASVSVFWRARDEATGATDRDGGPVKLGDAIPDADKRRVFRRVLRRCAAKVLSNKGYCED